MRRVQRLIARWRSGLFLLCTLMLLAAPPSRAADAEARLDALFATLAEAPDPGAAQSVADQIWRHWFVAPDDAAQALLNSASERRRAGDIDAAIATLDELTAGWPDYAEGWNQRATLFYVQGRLAQSLADISRVLALEPRHFGALSGRALVLFGMGRRDEANRTLLAALRVHPWLNERALLDPAYREEPL